MTFFKEVLKTPLLEPESHKLGDSWVWEAGF